MDHGSFKIRLDISFKNLVCRSIDMTNSLKIQSCVFKMLLYIFFLIQVFVGLNLMSNAGVSFTLPRQLPLWEMESRWTFEF